MSKKLSSSEKLGVAIGVLILLGGGGYLLYRLMTKKQRECEKAGGKWDKETKTCVLPKKDQEIVKKAYDNLTFASGKATILNQSFSSLNDLAEYLLTIPALALSIEGHTDSQGDEDYNQKLSENRAKAVKAYLITKGVKADQIKAIGFGESKPISDNGTAEGREKNRRVEFVIS
jgi:outer membrane protein OmpA-like peptidoglycan-associated protein